MKNNKNLLHFNLCKLMYQLTFTNETINVTQYTAQSMLYGYNYNSLSLFPKYESIYDTTT